MKEKDRKKAIKELGKEFPGIGREYNDAVNEHDILIQRNPLYAKTIGESLEMFTKSNEFKSTKLAKDLSILEGKEKGTVVVDNLIDKGSVKRTDFNRNDILQIIKFNPYDLLVKSTYSMVVLKSGLTFSGDGREIPLIKKIIEHEKFKNIKIDDRLVKPLIYTDNTIYKRKLFYPAFFIDADFEFDNRFIVKGMVVFECQSIRKEEKIVDVKFDGIVNEDTHPIIDLSFLSIFPSSFSFPLCPLYITLNKMHLFFFDSSNNSSLLQLKVLSFSQYSHFYFSVLSLSCLHFLFFP